MRNTVLSRLFFAIRPPFVVARRIAHAFGSLDATMLDPDRLHITLFILDDALRLDPELASTMSEIGKAVRSAPIAVVLDRLVASDRSIALRPSSANTGLRALHAELAGLAGAATIVEREGYRFGAHMTLGYGGGAPSSRRVAPIEWLADELVLIHSHVGRTRHEVLDRWPLAGGGTDPQLSLL